MTIIPRIRLRTIFLLFFCAAVGLATYPDVFGALLPTAATAIVIGLLQQTRSLLAWRPDEVRGNEELEFARRFALAWRLVLAATIVACLLLAMISANGLNLFPERENYYYIEIIGQGILPLCLIIVLCNSLVRWRPTSHNAAQHPGRIALICGLALVIGLHVLVGVMTVEFLVHRALTNIEAAQPKRFQRAGLYPNLGDEGYRSLWLASGAVLCLLVAGAITSRLRRRPNSIRVSTWLKQLTVLLLLIPPSIFCYWYYTFEFHRLSPEMADVGLAMIWWDWLAGAWTATILVTAAAYRIGVADSPQATIVANIAQDSELDAFHESFPGLLLLAVYALYELVRYGITMIEVASAFGPINFARCIDILCDPPALLTLITSIASVQLCWIRWRRREQIVAWKIAGLSQTDFFQGWIALASILVVAIPTLRAFAFILWLGPIDLLPFVGL